MIPTWLAALTGIVFFCIGFVVAMLHYHIQETKTYGEIFKDKDGEYTYCPGCSHKIIFKGK